MSCDDNNEDTAFRRQKTSKAMYDADLTDRECSQDLSGYLLHLFESHRLIRLVLQFADFSPAGAIAHNSFKNDQGAILRLYKRIPQVNCIDGSMNQAYHVIRR